METLGSMIDQLSVNALKARKYRSRLDGKRGDESPEERERLAAVVAQHVRLTRDLEAALILTLFGLREHRPFRAAKLYGGKLS